VSKFKLCLYNIREVGQRNPRGVTNFLGVITIFILENGGQEKE
jgi:hypothetical protein